MLAVAAAAFALRAGAAVLTEVKPLFPEYYYADAAFADREARATLDAWARGERRETLHSPAQKAHVFFTAALYRAAGRRPLAPKLANALAAALGIGAFGLLAGSLFGPPAGRTCAILLALWPSHAFYTAQNFKEGLVFGALMGAFLLLTPRDGGSPGRGAAEAAAGLALLSLLGFLRSYAMILAAASLAAAAAAALLRGRGPRRAAALALAACLTAPVLHRLARRAFLDVPVAAPETPLLPAAGPADGGATLSPFSPRGITEARRARQYSDRLYAESQNDREIGTQLFPEARMDSWPDVLLFAPKAAFHVLFMPLPGLYPLDGKPGRVLAALENLCLLAMCAAGAAAAARGGFDPRRAGLLLFFAAMTAASSLLESDLGSAGRHKLMYLPMLLPFAAEGALRLLGEERS